MSLLQQPKKLHLTGYILVWVQALLGGVLLSACWSPLAYAVFIPQMVIALLCIHIGKRPVTRIVTRAVISVFWVLALILAATLIEGLSYGLPQTHIESLTHAIAIVIALYLCTLLPVATAAMLFHGEHTVGYDRLMGCVVAPTQAGTAYLAVTAGVDVPWTVGGFLPYLWLALSIVTTVIVWLCARIRTPEQEAAIERQRQQREEKRAARKAKQ